MAVSSTNNGDEMGVGWVAERRVTHKLRVLKGISNKVQLLFRCQLRQTTIKTNHLRDRKKMRH